jgi:succinyl-CoA synthetase beta subunit
MEIEEVADKTPEKIIKEAIDPAVGFQGLQRAQRGLRIWASRRWSRRS